MTKLFLVSSFSDTYKEFPAFAQENLTGKNLIFIDTASHTEERTSYVDKAYDAWIDLGLDVNRVDIFAPNIADTIRSADFIYVAGGNTFYLLQELRKSGVDELIKQHIKANKVYIGESAGSIIMSPNIEYIKEMDDITMGPELTDYVGFGFISEYPLPHVGNKYLNEAVEAIQSTYGKTLTLHPFTDEETFIINN